MQEDWFEVQEELIDFIKQGDAQLSTDQIPSLQPLYGLEPEEFIFVLNKQLRERYEIMENLLAQNNVSYDLFFSAIFDEEEILDKIRRYVEDAHIVKSLLLGG